MRRTVAEPESDRRALMFAEFAGAQRARSATQEVTDTQWVAVDIDDRVLWTDGDLVRARGRLLELFGRDPQNLSTVRLQRLVAGEVRATEWPPSRTAIERARDLAEDLNGFFAPLDDDIAQHALTRFLVAVVYAPQVPLAGRPVRVIHLSWPDAEGNLQPVGVVLEDGSGRWHSFCSGATPALSQDQAFQRIAEWAERHSGAAVSHYHVQELARHGDGLLPLATSTLVELAVDLAERLSVLSRRDRHG